MTQKLYTVRTIITPLQPSDSKKVSCRTSQIFGPDSVTGSWNWDEDVFPPVLDRISIDFRRGKLVAIVGPVGCGKSSLLSAILGDIPKLKGSAYINGTKSYVAQQAWVQNATLRENIIFGQNYDEAKYERVLRVCELRADIDMLPHGDSTEIGEKGQICIFSCI